MTILPKTSQEASPSLAARSKAMVVHLYTASGLLFATLTFFAIFDSDYKLAFFYLLFAAAIDGTDGMLARYWSVSEALPSIDGYKIDALVDWLNITFLPLVLLGVASLLPPPAWLWISLVLITGVFDYSRDKKMVRARGCMLGFPAFYNVFSLYAAIFVIYLGSWGILGLLICVAILSLLPIPFLKPTAARQFRAPLLVGGAIWFILLLVLISQFPNVSLMLTFISLIFPVTYIVVSMLIVRSIFFRGPNKMAQRQNSE